MAVIGSTPRLHRVGCDSEFQKLARAGFITELHTAVEEGTYPRSGFHHPKLAIGDHLELVIGKNGMRLVQDHQPLYEVIEIGLERSTYSNQWLWLIGFKKLEIA
ncbi:MAG: hypothetical protein ACTH7L_01720 [Psychrobacter alimentarius]